MIPALGAHITFDAADLELQMAAHKVTATSAVLCFAAIGLPNSRRRLKIKAVRIIGTCAICGQRGPVESCEECDRDADKPCLVERNSVTLCSECAA